MTRDTEDGFEPAFREWPLSHGRYREPRLRGYDPWNASQMATWLQDEDGLQIMEVRQGTRTLSEPFKTLVGLIADGKHVWCGSSR